MLNTNPYSLKTDTSTTHTQSVHQTSAQSVHQPINKHGRILIIQLLTIFLQSINKHAPNLNNTSTNYTLTIY